ncbi:MAG: thermonuclease family protein [Candidatus Omnitrophica bacterium]|nr:thermonuclease family protein [Candidatus Omnitrophota bacterium]
MKRNVLPESRYSRLVSYRTAAILILLIASHLVFAETSLPEVKTYGQLVGALIRVREQTRAEIAQAIRQAKVREAWETGTLIEKHLAENGYVPSYGDKVTARLAAQLGISRSLLNRMRSFARAYPSGVPVSSLSWNDYILLMRVSYLKKREELAAAAEKENWTYDHLALEVRQWRARNAGVAGDWDKLPETPLPKVGIYPWVMIDGKKHYSLGFSAYLEKGRVPDAEIPPGKGAGEENFHTYEAMVTRVVDGDTFRARIKVGFGIVVDQRVRLKRIDAPEIQTEEGTEAKALLEKILARDDGRVVLQTFGMDQRGRSLANVWVQGKPVDQEILDADLALPMEG